MAHFSMAIVSAFDQMKPSSCLSKLPLSILSMLNELFGTAIIALTENIPYIAWLHYILCIWHGSEGWSSPCSWHVHVVLIKSAYCKTQNTTYEVCCYTITHASACSQSSHVSPALDRFPALHLQVWLTGVEQDGSPAATFLFIVTSEHSLAVRRCLVKSSFSAAGCE